MMDLSTIRTLSREAAVEAHAERLEPLLYTEDTEIQRIPNLGDHRPDGWVLTRVFFVDSSGWGETGEGALTLEEFTEKLVVGRGYGLIQEGQFQCHIGEFAVEGEESEEVDIDHHAIFSAEGW